MLPTIIFFLALLFTFITLILLINDWITQRDHDLSLVVIIFDCILWSILFYLLH